jgi:MerR family transcriptional regulator/heat shock protein HspR
VAALQERVHELLEQLDQARAAAASAQADARASLRRDLVPLRDNALVVWQPRR